LSNKLIKAPLTSEQDIALANEAVEALVIMLAPITPHMSHELWIALGKGNDVLEAAWPTVDESALVEDEKLIVVQINGKLRAKLTVAADATEEQVKTLAFADENVTKFTEGKEIRKVIYVPGKLLNVVVG
jgi:leucyl-tRNA synthetase